MSKSRKKHKVVDKKILIEKQAHNFVIRYPHLERKYSLEIWQQDLSNNILYTNIRELERRNSDEKSKSMSNEDN